MFDQIPNKKLKHYEKFAMPNLEFDFARNIKEMQGLQYPPDIIDCVITDVI